MARPKPVLLLILDGWGHRDETAAQRDREGERAELAPSARRVPAHAGRDARPARRPAGRPDGQFRSRPHEHRLGPHRLPGPDPHRRRDRATADSSTNAALVGACDAAKERGGTLHVIGLLSPGGVHSHEDHIFAMLDLAARRGVSRIAVHAFLDGRDTPPRSARASLEKLEAKCARFAGARIASVSGRYFAMDRDKRWDRVQLAYDAIAERANRRCTRAAPSQHSSSPTRAARTTSSSSRPSSAAARRSPTATRSCS